MIGAKSFINSFGESNWWVEGMRWDLVVLVGWKEMVLKMCVEGLRCITACRYQPDLLESGRGRIW